MASVGERMQLMATVVDAGGTVLDEPAINWISSNPEIAEVSASGLVTALSPGFVSITAAAGAESARASIMVNALRPPATNARVSSKTAAADRGRDAGIPTGRDTRGADSDYANEPAGMTPVTTHPGNAKPGGWWEYNPRGRLTYAPATVAAKSPPNVLQFRYPRGLRGGVGPGGFTGYGSLQKPLRVAGDRASELFIAFYWQVSTDWQQPTGALTKLWYTFQQTREGSRNSLIPMLHGTGPAPWRLYVEREVEKQVARLEPNVRSTRIYDDRWYKMEFYFKKSSAEGAADGIVRWWIDGELQGNHAAARLSSKYFSEFHLNPIWGSGSTKNKQKSDYMRFAHIYISAR